MKIINLLKFEVCRDESHRGSIIQYWGSRRSLGEGLAEKIGYGPLSLGTPLAVKDKTR